MCFFLSLSQCVSVCYNSHRFIVGEVGYTGGWVSMSPLPRLHHHDIMTIVELLHRATTKFFCEGKNLIPWP